MGIRRGKGGVTGECRRSSGARKCQVFRHSPFPKLALFYPIDLHVTTVTSGHIMITCLLAVLGFEGRLMAKENATELLTRELSAPKPTPGSDDGRRDRLQSAQRAPPATGAQVPGSADRAAGRARIHPPPTRMTSVPYNWWTLS